MRVRSLTDLCRLGAVASALVVFGCGGGDGGTEPGTVSIVGLWGIQSFNGQPAPPYTLLQAPGYRLEVTAQVISANADRTFTDNYTLRETQGTAVTTQSFQDRGTWAEASGSAYSYRYDGDPDTYVATVSGDTFTTTVDGDVYVFRRQ